MLNTGTRLTLQEFLTLTEGDVNYEFVDGQAVPKVSPKFFHSTLQAALLTHIPHLNCHTKGDDPKLRMKPQTR